MTQRRLSKRSTAVTKRRVLEEKLEKRREELALRSQKKKSKALQKLHSQEIDSYSEEALRLGEIVDRLYASAPDSDSSDNQSFKSLEWDNSDEAPPSFLADRTHSLTERTQSDVNDIIDSILNLDNPADCQENPLLPEPLMICFFTRLLQ